MPFMTYSYNYVMVKIPMLTKFQSHFTMGADQNESEAVFWNIQNERQFISYQIYFRSRVRAKHFCMDLKMCFPTLFYLFIHLNGKPFNKHSV